MVFVQLLKEFLAEVVAVLVYQEIGKVLFYFRDQKVNELGTCFLNGLL